MGILNAIKDKFADRRAFRDWRVDRMVAPDGTAWIASTANGNFVMSLAFVPNGRPIMSLTIAGEMDWKNHVSSDVFSLMTFRDTHLSRLEVIAEPRGITFSKEINQIDQTLLDDLCLGGPLTLNIPAIGNVGTWSLEGANAAFNLAAERFSAQPANGHH